MKRSIASVAIALLACTAAFPAEASSVDDLTRQIAQLKSYEEGQSRTLLNGLQLRIVEVAKDPASRAKVVEALAGLLQDGQTTTAAKRFACRQLQTLGTEAHVPLLTKLLADADLADLARGALERIPGDASAKALREGLATCKGAVLIGVINSLGLRGDGASAESLATLTDSTDEGTAGAALTALGRIATPEAADALLKARAAKPLLAVLQDAQLRCAERLARAGNKEVAAKIYRQVWSSDRPVAWRLAALAGLARVAGEEAAPMVLEALAADDPLCQAMAMSLARQLPGAKLTEVLVQRLSKLAPAGQVLLLDVLAERADPAAAGAVAKLAESTDETVRAAAFRTMARVGNAESVVWLTQRAAGEKGALQQAAREALAKLATEGVNERLLALAVEGEAGPRIEAIRALAARQVPGATVPLLKQTAETDQGIRNAAFQALAVLAGPEAYAPLLQRVIALATEGSASSEEALRAVAGRIATPTERTAPVITALKEAAPPVRAALLRVLGSLGGTEALAAIRAQLGDGDASVRDAAVRALAGSTDAAVAPDLLQLALKAENPVHRVLALRGYLRLVAATGDASVRMKMLGDIRPLATTTGFKKMLLGGLGDVPDAGAIAMAASFLDDAEVKTEAGMAVLRIGEALVKQDRTAVAAALTTLIEKVQDPGMQGRAKTLLAQAKRGGKGEKNALRPDNKRSGDVGKAPKGTKAAASEPAPAAAVATPPTNPNAEARVLILTGSEYPGHKWKETAPALADLLRKDTRLDVQVIEDPSFLASPDLKNFSVIVLNFMNWKTPDPGEAARTNLKEAIEGGTGLVLVHFACGAFQGWPEFVKVVGRVWNPTFRGHDPFGKFTVNIAKAEHPIMKGLDAFETTDELYTCLDGDTPIEVIAKATSKVDKKEYPMAFVLNYGKGRIFHCVLGHDVQAIVNPPVAELYRRGTAWAAGLK